MAWGEVTRAVIFFGVGLLIGAVVEYGVLGWLVGRSARRLGKFARIALGSLRGVPLVWGAGLGAYAAVLSLPLEGAISGTLLTAIRISLAIAVIMALMRAASRGVRAYLEQQGGILASSTIFINVARALILTLGLLTILQLAGVSIAPLLTTLGVGGLAVALALQDTLGNIFSGIYIVLSKKFLPGDYVRLETGEEGYINDINWSNTTIRTLANNMLVAPNSLLTSARITNFERPSRDLTVSVDVGVHYDSDLEHVERVTIDVARETLREVQGGVREFEPFIRYGAFADFRITLTVFLRASAYADQFLLRHEFIKRLHRRYREEGIVIPYPIRRVEMLEQMADDQDRALRPTADGSGA